MRRAALPPDAAGSARRFNVALLAGIGVVVGVVLAVQAALIAGWVVLYAHAAAADDKLRQELAAIEAKLALTEKRLDDATNALVLLPERSAEQVGRALDGRLAPCGPAEPRTSEEPPPASPWIP